MWFLLALNIVTLIIFEYVMNKQTLMGLKHQ